MNAVDRTRQQVEVLLDMIAEEAEHLEPDRATQALRLVAGCQQQVCNLVEAFHVVQDRLDTLEDKLDRYRSAEL